MSDRQPRTSEGKFDSIPRTEPELPENGGMAQAPTFCFPIKFSSIEEYIDFYTNVEIPEITLSNVDFAYRDYSDRRVKEQAEEWYSKFYYGPEFQKELVAAEKKRMPQAEFDELLLQKYVEPKRNELRRSRLMELSLIDVPTVARYGQMWNRAGQLDKAGIEAVEAITVTFQRKTITVGEMVRQLEVRAWIEDAANTSDLRAARASEKSAETIVKALEGLGNYFDPLLTQVQGAWNRHQKI